MTQAIEDQLAEIVFGLPFRDLDDDDPETIKELLTLIEAEVRKGRIEELKKLVSVPVIYDEDNGRGLAVPMEQVIVELNKLGEK